MNEPNIAPKGLFPNADDLADKLKVKMIEAWDEMLKMAAGYDIRIIIEKREK